LYISFFRLSMTVGMVLPLVPACCHILYFQNVTVRTFFSAKCPHSSLFFNF
jgi:hypothetical protein